MKLVLALFCTRALAAPEQQTVRTEETVPQPWTDRMAARTAGPEVQTARTEETVPQPWTDRMAARTASPEVETARTEETVPQPWTDRMAVRTVTTLKIRTVRAGVSCPVPC